VTERLVGPVLRLCDDGVASLPPGPIADRLREVRQRLDGPLRVAVAGRLKAGKSTLVNALVRERIAPTDVGECTKVVTWFQYGFPERVTVEPRVGEPWELPLGERFALPDELGAETSSIERVVVSLSIEALRAMTIIDTPGLASNTALAADATRELFAIDGASRRGVGQADAILYLFDHQVGSEDLEVLAAIERTGGGMRASAINCLGVLTKTDLLGPPAEVEVRAAELARRHGATLKSAVSGVVPVVGLVAEAVESGAFTQRDATTLRSLAALGPDVQERLLLSVERFRALDVPTPAAERERLLYQLGLFGIGVGLETVAAGRSSSADLTDELRRRSGIGPLRDAVEATFGRYADALQADRAMLALERLSYERAEEPTAAVLGSIRNELERIRLAPEMHVLAEIRALQDCGDPRAGIPEALSDTVRRLLSAVTDAARVGLPEDATPSEVQAAAAEQVTYWRAYVNGGAATPAAVRVAETVSQSYELAWARAAA
jgi:hypothetical protein